MCWSLVYSCIFMGILLNSTCLLVREVQASGLSSGLFFLSKYRSNFSHSSSAFVGFLLFIYHKVVNQCTVHSYVAKRKQWAVTVRVKSLYLLVSQKAVSCDASLIFKHIPKAFSQAELLLNLLYMLSNQAVFGLAYIKTSLHPPCLNQTGRFSGSDQITSMSPAKVPPAPLSWCPAAPAVWGDQVASCQHSPAAARLDTHAGSQLPH